MPKLSQIIPFLALLAAFTLFGPQTNQGAKSIATLRDFAASHPNCLEWTDVCTVCQRAEGKVSCSLPGFACQPAEMMCKRGE